MTINDLENDDDSNFDDVLDGLKLVGTEAREIREIYLAGAMCLAAAEGNVQKLLFLEKQVSAAYRYPQLSGQQSFPTYPRTATLIVVTLNECGWNVKFSSKHYPLSFIFCSFK